MKLRDEIREELMAYEDTCRHATGERYQNETTKAADAILAAVREALLSPEMIRVGAWAEAEWMTDFQNRHAYVEPFTHGITAALDAITEPPPESA